jgi:hypothetical protein
MACQKAGSKCFGLGMSISEIYSRVTDGQQHRPVGWPGLRHGHFFVTTHRPQFGRSGGPGGIASLDTVGSYY